MSSLKRLLSTSQTKKSGHNPLEKLRQASVEGLRTVTSQLKRLESSKESAHQKSGCSLPSGGSSKKAEAPLELTANFAPDFKNERYSPVWSSALKAAAPSVSAVRSSTENKVTARADSMR